MKVYLGWDPRELEAWDLAAYTLRARATVPVDVTPLKLRACELWGLLRRPTEMRAKSKGRVHANGLVLPREITAAQAKQRWDTISDAPMSTEFAISRFLTPLLAQTGWALFADCDVLFLGDVAELVALADPRYALMCVKHSHLSETATKMDGQTQTVYARKNWSSVMLFNCDHPANLGLTLEKINTLPGRDLHRFCWLHDELIGALPLEWNWLVGVEPMPHAPKVAHFTLGGPWLPDWSPKPHDDLWLDAQADHRAHSRADQPRRSAQAMPHR